MKAIVYLAHPYAPLLYKLVDSDLQPMRKPLFLPDFDPVMSLVPAVVARLDRAGKSVPLRFARRYHTAHAIGYVQIGQTLLQHTALDGTPFDAALSFDAAGIVGEFSAEPLPPSVTFFKNGTDMGSLDTARLLDLIDEAIARISLNTTVKTGDYVFASFRDFDISPAIGDAITTDTGLTLNIK